MRRVLVFIVLTIACVQASAVAVSCPLEKDLAGSYQTSGAEGNPSNTLLISAKDNPKRFHVTLNSFAKPKSYFGGEVVTLGEFEGDLFIPRPWSCAAILEIRESSGDDSPPRVCGLIFRFIGKTVVYVESIGLCSHGKEAYPDGKYTKDK